MKIIRKKVILNYSTVCMVYFYFYVYAVFKDIEFKLSEKDIEIRWKNWKSA